MTPSTAKPWPPHLLKQIIEGWIKRSKKLSLGGWHFIKVDPSCWALCIQGFGGWVAEIERDHVIIDYKGRTRLDAADPQFFEKLETAMFNNMCEVVGYK